MQPNAPYQQQQGQYPPMQQGQYQQQGQYPQMQPQMQQVPPGQYPQGMPQQGYPNQPMAAPVSEEKNDWQIGTFGCFGDISTCLCVYFCAPCAFNQVDKELDLDSQTQCLHMCIYCCFSPQIAMWIQRGVIKRRYNLESTDCDDFLRVCFCGICTIGQHKLEIEYWGAPENATMQK